MTGGPVVIGLAVGRSWYCDLDGLVGWGLIGMNWYEGLLTSGGVSG